LIEPTRETASPKLPLTDGGHEGATAAGNILSSAGWGFAGVPMVAGFLVTGRSPKCLGWSPTTSIVGFYRLLLRRRWLAHLGSVVLNAPRPTLQPVEEWQSTVSM